MTFDKTAEDNKPRVYVASLADYNNGDLLGRFFLLEDYTDAGDLLSGIGDMLRHYDELYPLPFGAKREEYAVHDYEHIPKQLYSESMDFKAVYEWLDAIADMDEERTEAYDLYINNGDEPAQFNDRYMGKYGDRPYDDDYTAATYAEESYYEQYGEDSIPTQLQDHINWGSMANDLVLGGDIFISNGHVFLNR